MIKNVNIAAGAVGVIGLSLWVAACAPTRGAGEASTQMSAGRSAIIAHRGASGHLPEHTLAAYALAYGQGSDMIEPDVVLTRDSVVICSHDLTITHSAVVEERFPERRRPDGKWYFIDFDLHELKGLNAALGRNAERVPGLQVATLDELLTMIARLNASTGRSVGVIPEIKEPAFHRQAGAPVEPVLLRVLASHGYAKRADAAIVQCFDLETLRLLRDVYRSDLRLVYLFGEAVPDQTLREFARFGDGVGPRRTLIERDDGTAGDMPGLLRRARELGLAVYPYTFKDEPAALARFVRVHRVDGVFADFPDVARRARDGE